MTDSPPAVELKYFPPAEGKFMPSVQKTYGVPQGAPTSCSTATLALRPGEKRVEGVRYADDGVYIGRIEENLPKLEDIEMGIEVNKEKTRELKRDGV